MREHQQKYYVAAEQNPKRDTNFLTKNINNRCKRVKNSVHASTYVVMFSLVTNYKVQYELY